MLGKDPEQLIETLWRVGLLKCQLVGRRTDGSLSNGDFVGPYEVRTLNTRNIRVFQVHAMFANYLGCT